MFWRGVWNDEGELVGITAGHLPWVVEFGGVKYKTPQYRIAILH